MRRNILFVSFIFLFLGNIYSQENTSPFISGYQNSFQQYFDSVNKRWGCQLSSFSGTYNFYIVFELDKNGKAGELEFYEVPGNEVPGEFRNYVRSLIRSTDGKWIVDDSSDLNRVVCNITVLRDDLNIDERAEVVMKIISFVIDNHEEKYSVVRSKLSELERSKDRKNIIISY